MRAMLPHDCRRVFASEHLNNNTPVHVIQALLVFNWLCGEGATEVARADS